MNFEQFEQGIKKHKILSIPLIILFILGVIFQFTDAYTRISSFLSTKEYNLKIELLTMNKNYIHVASVTSRKDPYVSYIGSWYKFRLTNNGEKSYSLINILYRDNQKLEAYKKYYIDKDIIYLSETVSFPKTIKTNESIELYIFIPLKINKILGKKLFSLLYTPDNNLDTLVELYLFGNKPIVKNATVPRYDNGKFVGTVSINVEVQNWDDFIAQRVLYNQIDRINNIITFDNDVKDGFIYQDINKLLSKVITPTQTKIDINDIYKNDVNMIPIVFELNNHMKFKKDLYIGSTGLLLIDKYNKYEETNNLP